ncbi:hypothetical protein OF364_01440 [Mycoplasma enhydrae]|uniref:hypothetical protein n=1 Tax=Mycoplasma enhydrae TaxID=2499220 RepID=UPI0021E7FB99|nr:hypothetical protein [Mycoplasma enhydrae]MCV3753476.1 hypothetical protein [Mycoplasma enhydrae]
MNKKNLLSTLIAPTLPLTIISVSCNWFNMNKEKIRFDKKIDQYKGYRVTSVFGTITNGPIEPAYKKNDIIFSLEDKSKDPNYQSITIKDFKGQKNQEKTIYFLIPYKEKLKYKNKELKICHLLNNDKLYEYKNNGFFHLKCGLGYEYYSEENNSEYYFEGKETQKIPIMIEINKIQDYLDYEIILKINNTYQKIYIEGLK